LQVHIRAAEIIRRHAGGRICIDCDHFRIPLLLCYFCDFRAASGRFFMVFDLTLPGFPGKFVACFDFQNKWLITTRSESVAQAFRLRSKILSDGFIKMSPCGDSLLVNSSLICDGSASLPFLFPVLGFY